LRAIGTDGEGTFYSFRSAALVSNGPAPLRMKTYSWYELKPFWYLYFSGVLKLVTGMLDEGRPVVVKSRSCGAKDSSTTVRCGAHCSSDGRQSFQSRVSSSLLVSSAPSAVLRNRCSFAVASRAPTESAELPCARCVVSVLILVCIIARDTLY
jgi:hypothetical protein